MRLLALLGWAYAKLQRRWWKMLGMARAATRSRACAWCGKVTKRGLPWAETSHGICRPCAGELLNGYQPQPKMVRAAGEVS